jgi:hypothetical protein
MGTFSVKLAWHLPTNKELITVDLSCCFPDILLVLELLGNNASAQSETLRVVETVFAVGRREISDTRSCSVLLGTTRLTEHLRDGNSHWNWTMHLEGSGTPVE